MNRNHWPVWALLAVRAGTTRATDTARRALEADGRARSAYDDHQWQANRLAEMGALQDLR